jgi:hypothetical protein
MKPADTAGVYRNGSEKGVNPETLCYILCRTAGKGVIRLYCLGLRSYLYAWASRNFFKKPIAKLCDIMYNYEIKTLRGG